MNIRNSYQEATVRGAAPVDLVVRLYEQMIADLRQASIALENNDIESRSNHMKHVILVIGHLQSSLDLVHGSKTSQDLDHFYTTLRQNTLWVQFHPSQSGIAQLITDLLTVREAWTEVSRIENQSAVNSAGKASNGASDTLSAHVDWEG